MSGERRADPTALRTAMRWAGRGVWALADQGLVSVSHFAVNVLLARWLPANEYGAFTVGFSTLLVAGSFHGALLTDPMLVFGISRFAGRTTMYLRVLLIGHCCLVAPLALSILAGGLALRPGALSSALLGLALGAPFYLLFTLVRRACYVGMEPKHAAVASGIYSAASLCALIALAETARLSPASGFLALAAGGAVGSLWLLPWLGVGFWSPPSRTELAEVLRVHWVFSRWTLGANLAQWLRSNVYFFVLPLQGGLEAGAALRALSNLIMPLAQPLAALSPLLLPAFARARSRSNFRATVARVGGLLGAAALAYWLLLGAFGETVFRWVYAGKYVEHANLVWAIGFIPVSSGIGAAVGTALRAVERPDRDFWATAVSAGLALVIGAPLTMHWGVTGAVTGLTISYVAVTALLSAAFLSLRVRPSEPRP
jgi:O-antigen/teichoic acid export membrane protein